MGFIMGDGKRLKMGGRMGMIVGGRIGGRWEEGCVGGCYVGYEEE